MKHHNTTPHTPRRTLLRSLAGMLALATGLASTTHAAEYYLKASQGSSNHWSSHTSDWTANPDGTGANPVVITNADTFDTNNRTVRTPALTYHAPKDFLRLFVANSGRCPVGIGYNSIRNF